MINCPALTESYLGVVQHFGLGGVGLEAQHFLSAVKSILNSPRIHLFMAPSMGARRRVRLNPFLIDTSTGIVLVLNRIALEEGAVFGTMCCCVCACVCV